MANLQLCNSWLYRLAI